VTASVARALSLDSEGGEEARAQGARGGIGAVATTLRSFRWGDEELADVRVMQVTMDHVCGLVGQDIAGIIGYDLLSLHRLTIDYQAHALTLERVRQT